MNYIKSFSISLQRNSLVRLIVKKVIPRKIRISFQRYLNTDISIRLFFKNDIVLITYKDKAIQELVPVFYWDSVPNFGDVIGAYLVSRITGKQVLNVHSLQHAGIMAVGSILQMINRENMVVWGSGLIAEPTDEVIENLRKYKPKILSVRGSKTAKHLSEAGIAIPDQSVYGDPALILPLFYNPSVSSSKKVGVCPHYIHKSHFLKNIPNQDGLKVIDVQKDMESVVDSISSSTVCISTSLHGLIIAQAYGIPWVWLEVSDNNLTGDDFKFKDFFSTLDESQVSHFRIKMEEVDSIDFLAIAANATLPNKLYNEELILESLKKHLHGTDIA